VLRDGPIRRQERQTVLFETRIVEKNIRFVGQRNYRVEELVLEHVDLKCDAFLEKSAVIVTHNSIHILSYKRFVCLLSQR
jgi:hypothetical protein